MPFEDLTPETQNILRRKAPIVKSLGLQTVDRFKDVSDSKDQHDIPPPTIREWRLNLTRLSHVFNLYLIAFKDRIFVYEPSYPNQTISCKPSLIISPPRSPNAHSGTLDRECPHSINHLVVDFLGELEVVMIACDDGDVLGYYMHDIQAAIDRRVDPSGPTTVKTHKQELKPFYKYNVGCSAWGLAIHSHARKIAISSNSHAVDVITLGLTERPNGCRFGCIKCEHRDHKLLAAHEGRFHDYTMRIQGFRHNLPSVAFCNTDDDPEGRLLVTGELTGFIYIQDLARPQPSTFMQNGFCKGTDMIHCACNDKYSYPHAIWGLSYIDRKAFRHVWEYVPNPADSKTYSEHWNGSLMRSCVPDSSGTYALKRYGHHAHAVLDGNMSSDEEDDHNDDDDDDSDSDVSSLPATEKQNLHIPASLQSMTHPWYANVQPTQRNMMGQSQGTGKRFYLSIQRPLEPNFDLEDAQRHRPRMKVKSPLLILSKNDLLLQQPDRTSDSDREAAMMSMRDDSPATEGAKRITPVIALEEPLKQGFDLGASPVRPSFTTGDTNRMSLHYVIPELGVLLVGTPAGRVGVFSLLRTDQWPSRPEGCYFVRLDWLLPLKSEEDMGRRPERKLVGLTAGPMQGQLAKARQGLRRSWRVLMYYAGHEVLAYELKLPD